MGANPGFTLLAVKNHKEEDDVYDHGYALRNALKRLDILEISSQKGTKDSSEGRAKAPRTLLYDILRALAQPMARARRRFISSEVVRYAEPSLPCQFINLGLGAKTE